MRAFKDQLEKQKGLKKPTLYQDAVDRTQFNLTHEWETREDLERYSNPEEFKALLGSREVLCEESEIRRSNTLLV